ncbi:hypothetical protein F4703DRAFT_1917931 [Phycomyces blakesleeanus]
MKLSLFTISALALAGMVSAAPAVGCAEKHIAAQGETCVSVAAKFDITVKEFQGFNLGHGSEINNCKSLVVGSSYCVKPLSTVSKNKRSEKEPEHKKPIHKPSKVVPKPIKPTQEPNVEHPQDKRGEKEAEHKKPIHKPSKVVPKPIKPTQEPNVEHPQEKRGENSPKKEEMAKKQKKTTKKPVKTTYKPSNSTKKDHAATPKGAHHATRAVSDCKKYHVVKSGETCKTIAKENKITMAQFKQFNSGLSQAIDSECQKLVVGQSYCISY